jgi:hypothetical protein
MLIVFGKKYMGKVGIAIPGYEGRYVKTSFYQIFFLPLIPVESMIIREEDDEDWGWYATIQGIPTNLQWKSIVMAWLEMPLVAVGGFATLPSVLKIWCHFHNESLSSDWWPAILAGWCVLPIVVAFYWLFRWLLAIRPWDKL